MAHDFSDVDFEALAARLADHVFNYTISTDSGDLASGDSVTTVTTTGGTGGWNTDTIWIGRDPYQPYTQPEGELNVNINVDMLNRIHTLEQELAKAKETIELLAKIVDEHIKRSYPEIRKKVHRTLILEEEEV